MTDEDAARLLVDVSFVGGVRRCVAYAMAQDRGAYETEADGVLRAMGLR